MGYLFRNCASAAAKERTSRSISTNAYTGEASTASTETSNHLRETNQTQPPSQTELREKPMNSSLKPDLPDLEKPRLNWDDYLYSPKEVDMRLMFFNEGEKAHSVDRKLFPERAITQFWVCFDTFFEAHTLDKLVAID